MNFLQNLIYIPGMYMCIFEENSPDRADMGGQPAGSTGWPPMSALAGWQSRNKQFHPLKVELNSGQDFMQRAQTAHYRSEVPTHSQLPAQLYNWKMTLCSAYIQSGAYERRSREGACNCRLHLGAIQIQIISQLTSKYGNHLFNQASE